MVTRRYRVHTTIDIKQIIIMDTVFLSSLNFTANTTERETMNFTRTEAFER